MPVLNDLHGPSVQQQIMLKTVILVYEHPYDTPAPYLASSITLSGIKKAT